MKSGIKVKNVFNYIINVKGLRKIVSKVNSYSGFYLYTVKKRDNMLVYETFKAPISFAKRKVLYERDAKCLKSVSFFEYPI